MMNCNPANIVRLLAEEFPNVDCTEITDADRKAALETKGKIKLNCPHSLPT